jgi:hypothetical protein
LAVQLGLRTLFDSLDQATLFGRSNRIKFKISADKLSEELIRMYLSYLGVGAVAPSKATEESRTSES